jgi:hypothetical protein
MVDINWTVLFGVKLVSRSRQTWKLGNSQMAA